MFASRSSIVVQVRIAMDLMINHLHSISYGMLDQLDVLPL